ncbi:MAG: hypothetical protein QOJ26_804, partial [Thermoplasmata archaeon]|nr:hypothetical protein [Thermoplasmata archaeon]
MRPARARTLETDETGAMLVVEAVLVAMLVLTAILFFISSQRPTAAEDTGGVDLATIATDTLNILETRSFQVLCVSAQNPSGPTNECEKVCAGNGLVTNAATQRCQVGPVECDAAPPADCCPSPDSDQACSVRRGALMRLLAAGDPATADEVDGFLAAVVPAGSKYLLRMDNGIGTMPLIPVNPDSTPRGARVSNGVFFPADWDTWQASIGATTQYATPGDVVAPGTVAYKWIAPPYATQSVQSPNGSCSGPDGAKRTADADVNPDPWIEVWRSGWDAATSTARVPTGLPYGAWINRTASSTCLPG